MSLLRNVRLDQWGWVHAKISLVCWGLMYLLDPPPGAYRELGTTLVVTAALFVVIGSLVSIFGLLLSSDNSMKRRHRGLAIEAGGLILTLCGPLSFFVVQISRFINGEVHITRAAFSYVLISLLIARTIVVLRALHKVNKYGI